MRLQGWQWIIMIGLAFMLFAAPKLPAMARNLGQSMRILKSEVKQMKDDDKPTAESEEEKSKDSAGQSEAPNALEK